MIFFKPISREPKTPSNAKPLLLRVPSIKTVLSTDPSISSPCPSESSVIPITPKRTSAFTIVGFVERFNHENEVISIVKSKPVKRRNYKMSPKKPDPKRRREEAEIIPKTVTRKTVRDVEPKVKTKTETRGLFTRKTRSMDKKTSDSMRIKIPASNASKNQGKRVTRSQSQYLKGNKIN